MPDPVIAAGRLLSYLTVLEFMWKTLPLSTELGSPAVAFPLVALFVWGSRDKKPVAILDQPDSFYLDFQFYFVCRNPVALGV